MNETNRKTGSMNSSDPCGDPATDSTNRLGGVGEEASTPPSDRPAVDPLPALCDEIEEGRLWVSRTPRASLRPGKTPVEG